MPAPQAHAAGPLSAEPSLQQVTEYSCLAFNSTMLTCDNTIPTSFLPWVKPGEEAVTTSVFHRSNPSLTSYQSGCLSSQCPCSFFSSSVSKQSKVVYLEISPLKHRNVCLPQRTPCSHCTSFWLLRAPRKLGGCILTHHSASVINQFL